MDSLITSAPRIVIVSVTFFPMGLFYYSSANGADSTISARNPTGCLSYEGVCSVQLKHISTGQIRGTSPRVRRKRTMAQGDAWYNSDCYGWLIKWAITRNYSRR